LRGGIPNKIVLFALIQIFWPKKILGWQRHWYHWLANQRSIHCESSCVADGQSRGRWAPQTTRSHQAFSQVFKVWRGKHILGKTFAKHV